MAVHKDVFILSLRQQVIFPAIRTNITVQPQTFTELCEFCEKNDSTNIGVIAVQSSSKGEEELYTTGTYCRIASHAQSSTKVGDKEVSVVTLAIEGQKRFRVESFTQKKPFHVATIKLLDETSGNEAAPELKALRQSVQEMVVELLSDTSTSPDKQGNSGGFLKNLFGNSKKIRWPTSASVLADMVAAGLGQLSIGERQQVLEMTDVQKRLGLVMELVRKVLEVQKLSQEINSKMQKRSEDELRETVLRRQLGELQKEMRKLKTGGKPDGGGFVDESADEEEDLEDDMAALRDALKKAQLPADAQKIAGRELKRLQNIQPQHPEYTVCRTYLETLSGLPWALSSQEDINLAQAHAILEKDHYGLDIVKRRILEFLAVRKMRGDMKGPILCLHGPPGVGKTSLGRSVAKALGRKFHRIALGGVRDEAELRGHRRTYIGSMPGAVIQALSTMKVNNPVILLDEIDKLTRNNMFNPSGALLELLDPEQNNTFKDHYLNTPFDLSKVLFLCTCNDLQSIDRPLLDRMEVINLSGYTVEEKVHIATTHLLPKQRKLHALERGADIPQALSDIGSTEASDEENSPLTAEEAEEHNFAAALAKEPPLPEEPRLMLSKAAIVDLITKWTMESGVRSLERRMAQVCRWTALRLAGDMVPRAVDGDGDEFEDANAKVKEAALKDCGPTAEGRIFVDVHHLPHIVGAEMFEPDLAERLLVGCAMGLGVNSVGGSLLFVEASRSKGSGRMTITGQLGDVMKESVTTAMSLLRSKIYYATLAATGDIQPIVRVGQASAAMPAMVNADAEAAEPPGNKFLEVFKTILDEHQDPTKDPFDTDDIHVHFPAGAIPKDGPSAGVATTIALASLLLGRPCRSDTAVTGEITLRGHVLPVGGIRDKVLAAHRAGVRHVLLPFGNQRHARDDIPASAMGDLEVHFVKHIDEALAWVFADNVKPWTPPEVSGTGSSSSEPSYASAYRAKL